MYRLPVLTRLARRSPTQVFFSLATGTAEAAANSLPETPFVNESGDFLWDSLSQRPTRSTLRRYVSPSAHPAALHVASGDSFPVVESLLASPAQGDTVLRQAEQMLSLATRCRELAVVSPEALPLQILELNWLGFAIGSASLPRACLGLFRLLQDLGVPASAAVAALEPGIRYLASTLDQNEAPWERLPAGVQESQADSHDARRHLLPLPAGLDCLVETAGVLLQTPDTHEPGNIKDFVVRARGWAGAAQSVLAQAQIPWSASDQLHQRLDGLAHWAASASRWSLPGYFGFPFTGTLPAVRVHERLGSLYLTQTVSPFFQGQRFSFEAFLAAETMPVDALLSTDPELSQAVLDAGGDNADFHNLGDRYYDELDAYTAADSEGSWDEVRSILFLRALTCRVLGVLRNTRWESANDLHSLLERYIKAEEQEVGITEAVALLVFAPLAAVLDDALRIGSDGRVQLVEWVEAFRSPQPHRQEAGRVRLQQLRFAWLALSRLLDEGRSFLVDLAGAHNQAALLVRVGDLAEDLLTVAQLPEMEMMLGSDVDSAGSFLGQALRLYRGAAEKRYPFPERRVAAGKSAASPQPNPSVTSDIPARPATEPLIQVVDAKIMDTYADTRFIKESWSQKKAERLKGGLALAPALPDRVSLLQAEFPWFPEIIDFIALWLARNVALGIAACRLPPLLLLGGYGSGKTYFSRRLAEVLGLPFRLLSAGGSTDNRQLAGTSRGWSTAYPALPVDFMAESGIANGLLVIDEVDKESDDRRNGRMTDTLLQLLEPTNARSFLDPCLGCAVDCSYLQWIITANSLKGINGALLSRVRLFTVSQPSRAHYPQLAQQIRLGFAREHGVDPRLLPVLDSEDLAVIQTRCRSVREVRQVTEWVLTRKIVDERQQFPLQ